jgi:hypothetical protein
MIELLQISAVLLAILFRVNLPVAAFTTLYTNPFTIVPLYLLAYEIGILITGSSSDTTAVLAIPDVHWQSAFVEVWNWLVALGKPLLVGLPQAGRARPARDARPNENRHDLSSEVEVCAE